MGRFEMNDSVEAQVVGEPWAVRAEAVGQMRVSTNFRKSLLKELDSDLRVL